MTTCGQPHPIHRDLACEREPDHDAREPVPVHRCALPRPPPPTSASLASSCPPHVCLTDDDERALSAELRALRRYAADAYADCPHASDEPPGW